MDRTIADALRKCAMKANLSPTQIGAKIGRSEQTARQYIQGKAIPSGDALLALMREVPGFADELGFAPEAVA